MKEKYWLMDILATEKCIMTNTATAMNEASSQAIYDLYSSIFTKISKEVKEVWAICYNNDWYKIEEATKTKIKEQITTMSNELNQPKED